MTDIAVIDRPDSEYGEVIVLDEYNGTYKIVSARKARDGDQIYKDWVFPSDRDRQPKEKSIPMGVRLGSRDEAISCLKQMLSALEGASGGSVDDSDEF